MLSPAKSQNPRRGLLASRATLKRLSTGAPKIKAVLDNRTISKPGGAYEYISLNQSQVSRNPIFKSQSKTAHFSSPITEKRTNNPRMKMLKQIHGSESLRNTRGHTVVNPIREQPLQRDDSLQHSTLANSYQQIDIGSNIESQKNLPGLQGKDNFYINAGYMQVFPGRGSGKSRSLIGGMGSPTKDEGSAKNPFARKETDNYQFARTLQQNSQEIATGSEMTPTVKGEVGSEKIISNEDLNTPETLNKVGTIVGSSLAQKS